MTKFAYNYFVTQGVNPATAGFLATAILATLAIVLSIIANFVAKRLILKGLARIVVHTETKWDDIFLESRSRPHQFSDLFVWGCKRPGVWLQSLPPSHQSTGRAD